MLYQPNILAVFIAVLSLYTYQSAQIHRQSNQTSNESTKFSGFYKPPKHPREEYAAAFLAHKSFLLSKPKIIDDLKKIERRGIEMAVFAVLDAGTGVMTRDYVDFEVIHLSSTVTMLPQPENAAIHVELLKRLDNLVKKYSSALKARQNNQHRDSYNTLYSDTIVVIPFSITPGSLQVNDNSDLVKFNYKSRLRYLQATVMSVKLFFNRIAVFSFSKKDIEIAKSLNLPIWKYIDFSERSINPTTLPKEILLYTINELQQPTSEWSTAKYIYYTEMDQLLHMRRRQKLQEFLDHVSTGILIPHRIQTVALPNTIPDAYNSWNDNWHSSRMEALKSVNVLIEDAVLPRGSCCDNGRFAFGDCGNWWYNCPKFGIHNYSTWLRLGETGYTYPLGTEHQAKCSYSASKVLCPIPTTCQSRNIKSIDDICLEMPNVKIIP